MLLSVRARGAAETEPQPSIALALPVVVIWTMVALASIFAPEMVTGSDPTRLPIAALIAPMAGTITTGFVCLYAASMRRPLD